MTDRTIRVTVDGSGARKGAEEVNDSLGSMKNQADTSRSALEALQILLLKFGSGAIGAMNTINSALTSMGINATTAIQGINQSISSMTTNAANSLNSLNGAMSGLSAVAANVSNAFGGMGTTVSNAFAAVKSTLASMGPQIASVGAQIRNTFAQIPAMIPPITSAIANIRGGFASLVESSGGWRNILTNLIPIDVLRQAAAAMYETVNRFQSFNATMTIVTGSVARSRQELEYLFNLSYKWGVDIDSLTTSYAKFSAAAKGTTLEGKQTRDVFESVTMAASAMHLSVEDVRLVMFALQQMVSKGNVSMEELRKQMAERFPGAVQLAAEGLGLTMVAMQNLIRQGKIMSDDMLPKLAAEINKTFSAGAEVSKNSLLAAVNRLHTAWEELILRIGESGVVERVTKIFGILSDTLRSNMAVANQFGDVISGVADQILKFLMGLRPEDVTHFIDTAVGAFRLLGSVVEGVVKIVSGISTYMINASDTSNRLGQILSHWDTNQLERAATLAAVLSGNLGGVMAGYAQLAAVEAKREKDLASNPRSASGKIGGMEVWAQKDEDAKTEANAYKQLSAQAQLYEISKQQVSVKLKENDAQAQLNNLIKERNRLEFEANNVENSPQVRSKAFTDLINSNQQYVALKKQVSQEAKASAAAHESELSVMNRAKRTLEDAKQDYEALGHAIEDKPTKALRELEKAMDSKAFRQLPVGKQSDIKALYDQAIAYQQMTAAAKESMKAQSDFLQGLDQKTQKFQEDTAQNNEMIRAMTEGTKATARASETQLEFYLSTDKAQAAMTQLSIALNAAGFGPMADAMLAGARAAAKAADDTRAYVKALNELEKSRNAEVRAEEARIENINKETERLRDQAEEIGHTKAERDQLRESRNDDTLAMIDAKLAASALDEMEYAEIRRLRELRDAILANRDARNAVTEAQKAADFHGAWVKAIDIVTDRFDSFVQDVINGGWASAFKKLWTDFVAWGLAALAKIAAQKLIVSMFPSMGQFAGPSPLNSLSTLLGLNGGIGGANFGSSSFVTDGPNAGAGVGFGVGSEINEATQAQNPLGVVGQGASAVSNFFGSGGGVLGSLGGMIGGSFGAALGAGFSAGISTLSIAANAGVAAIGGVASALGAMAAVAIPVIGAVVAIAALFGFFGKKGGPKVGGSAGTSVDVASGDLSDLGGERFFTPNQADSQLQSVVKEIGTNYAKVAKALGATTGNASFKLGFDTDPKGTADNRVSASASVNGQEVYNVHDVGVGRDDQALQDRLTLEAKRATLAALQSSDLPKYLANILNEVDAYTADSDAIDNILKEAAALKTAVDTMQGLGDMFTAMSPDDIKDFIDKFGGIDDFLEKFKQFNNDFTTSADKTAASQDKMNGVFNDLGIAVPKTHDQFVQVLDSLDLTTESGRSAYASIMGVSDAFVAIHGTADQAAQRMREAQKTINTGLYSSDQRQSMATTSLAADFKAVNLEMPTTHAGMLALVNGIDRTTDAGEELYETVTQRLLPSWLDLNGTLDQHDQAVRNAEGFFRQNFYSEGEQAQMSYNAALTKVNATATRLGIEIPHSAEGFRRLVEGIDRSTDAGELLYETLLDIAPEIMTVSGGLKDLGKAISGISVGQAFSQAQSFRDSVNQQIDTATANMSFGDALATKARLLSTKLGTAKEAAAEASARMGGMGDAVSEAIVMFLQQSSDSANKYLAQFTKLSADYGPDKAQKLVTLQQQYDQTAQSLLSFPDALRVYQEQFNKQWQAIIDGTSDGVEGTINELDKLRKNLLDYVDKLKVNDSLTTLTPRQQFQEALSQFNRDVAKANDGDTEAFGKVTDDSDRLLNLGRTLFASGPQYTALFDSVIDTLTSLGLGHDVDGDVADPLTAVLPTGAKIMSNVDAEKMTAEIVAAVMASAQASTNANTKDIAALKTGMADMKRDMVSATNRTGK